MFKNMKRKKVTVFLQQQPLPSYPSIVWQNFSQEHIRLPLICKQTSSRLSIGRHNTSPLPSIQSDFHNDEALQQGRKGGEDERRRGEGGGGGGRVKVRAEAEWRERVNSHVTGPSCSVDGKREIWQPQQGVIDVVFIKPHTWCIYHTAGRTENSSSGFPAQTDVTTQPL